MNISMDYILSHLLLIGAGIVSVWLLFKAVKHTVKLIALLVLIFIILWMVPDSRAYLIQWYEQFLK